MRLGGMGAGQSLFSQKSGEHFGGVMKLYLDHLQNPLREVSRVVTISELASISQPPEKVVIYNCNPLFLLAIWYGPMKNN